MNSLFSITRHLSLSLLFTVYVVMPPTAEAAEPPGCLGCNISVQPSTSVFVAGSGCTAPFTVRIGNQDPMLCNQTNLTVLFACPGNTPNTYGPTNVIRTGLSIPSGTTPFSLIDTNGDIIVIPCTITTAPGVDTVYAVAYATNNPGGCQRGPLDFVSMGGTVPIVITHPNVGISAQCLTATNAGTKAVITYSASITNSGDAPLQNVIVRHNHSSNIPILQMTVFSVGAVTNITRTYTNTSGTCGPFAALLTVTAQDAENQIMNCPSGSVTNQAAIGTCNYPCISVTRIVGALYELTCITEATKSYTVQFTDTLTNLNWQLLTNFVASAPTSVVTDSNGAPQRYYRLVAH